MACAISNEPRDYILECDRALPVEKQTVFKIKPLSVKDQAAITDLSIDKGSLRYGTIQYETVKRGLVGWSNFFEAGGVALCPFTDDKELNIAKLQEYWLELYTAIKDLSTPSEVELGNSDSPPSGNSTTSE